MAHKRKLKRDLGDAGRLLRDHGVDSLSELIRRLKLAKAGNVGAPRQWEDWLKRLVYLFVEEIKRQRGIGTTAAWRLAAKAEGFTFDQIRTRYVQGRALMRKRQPWDRARRLLDAIVAIYMIRLEAAERSRNRAI